MLCKSDEDELSVLCDIYGSDKGSISKMSNSSTSINLHTYTSVYHALFSPIRDQVKAVFECGIGTDNPNIQSSMGTHGRPGASLRVWRDYFKHAVIVGGDIDKDILFEENRIHTAFLDQTKPEKIKTFFSSLKPDYPDSFDIMIDDGLHSHEAAICLLENSFCYLKPGGIYVIEDMYESDITVIDAWLQKNMPAGSMTIEHKMMGTQWNANNNLIVIRKAEK
jgi:SAM-dependent methyltransferase